MILANYINHKFLAGGKSASLADQLMAENTTNRKLFTGLKMLFSKI